MKKLTPDEKHWSGFHPHAQARNFLAAARMLIITAVVVTSGSAQSDLRLVVDTDSGPVAIQRASNARLLVPAGEGFRSLPADTPVRIEGNLRQNARYIHWPLNYRIAHVPARERNPPIERPRFGYVRLVNGTEWTGTQFQTVWPVNVPDPAAVLFGWVVEGRIVETKLLFLPPVETRTDFRLDHVFRLDARHAAGHPVALLWANGRFLAPRPPFRQEAHREAIADLLLGNREAFETAVSRGLDCSLSGSDGESLLSIAAGAGLADSVDAIVRQSPVKMRPSVHVLSAALSWSAARGRTAAVERLLAAKAEVDGKSSRAMPLQNALFNGHDEVAAMLLSAGADVNYVGAGLLPPLALAIDGGFAALARQMLAQGARPSRPNPEMLFEQIRLGHVSAVKLLLEMKHDANSVLDQQSALLVAALSRSDIMVRDLLEAGARPNFAAPDGTTPLLMAVAAGNLDMVQRLISAGADVSAQRTDGVSAVHFAAIQGSADILSVLLQKGADPNASSTQGRRPLESALVAGNASPARLLAAHGATCDWNSSASDNTLEAAVALDLAAIVRTAVEGDTPAAHQRRTRAAQLARLLRSSECAELLRETAGALTISPLATAEELDSRPDLRSPAPAMLDPRPANDRLGTSVVDVEITIDERGAIVGPRIVNSPDPRLNFAALHTARQLRVPPPQRAGKAVAATLIQRIVFEPKPATTIDRSFLDAPPRPLTRYLPSLSWHQAPDEYITVYCIIAPDGRSEESRVARSTVPREIAREVERVIADWAFTPGTLNGQPVRSRVEVLAPLR